MPSKQSHRGQHPQDAAFFALEHLPMLREAVHDLCWLYSRGYNERSAIKLVGDRFQLAARQRTAVQRASCSDEAMACRREHEISLASAQGKPLALDGYNILIGIESALAGGVLIHARDGCLRDMASLHGSYRNVAETQPALARIGEFLEAFKLAPCNWYFDAPVSNSGRLRQRMLALAREHAWEWEVTLDPNPDRVLAASEDIAVSGDSWILDRASSWLNFNYSLVSARIPDAHIIDLRPVA